MENTDRMAQNYLPTKTFILKLLGIGKSYIYGASYNIFHNSHTMGEINKTNVVNNISVVLRSLFECFFSPLLFPALPSRLYQVFSDFGFFRNPF
jgi:hypothetical protein